MQFLSLSRRRTDAFPPEAFTPELVAREGQRVRELYASGILRQIWRRTDLPGAAILWEAPSEAEIRAALVSLPIFEAGMLEIRLRSRIGLKRALVPQSLVPSPWSLVPVFLTPPSTSATYTEMSFIMEGTSHALSRKLPLHPRA
jgi:muconolactone delta-isomerase